MTHSLVQIRPRSLPAGLDPIGPLGFGTWRFTTDDLSAAHELVETALDVGMNLIDTADVYGLDYDGSGFGGNEELLGKVLAQAPGLRDRMVLATKGGIMPPIPYDSSGAYLRSAVEASLGRLGVDVIDLYQIHRPDMFAHPAQVAETLSSLVGEGKIRAVGVSNHTPAQHDALIAHLGDLPLATSQPEYSPAFLGPLRDGTFDLCMRDGIVPLAWSPLGGGRLMSGENVPAALIATLDELAEREGVDRAAICYAFVLAHPSAPVALLGTQNPDRLRAAVAALDVTLDRNDVYRIVQDSEGVPLP
ncbi:MAG: aldo/keto reductase [Acidimicrobiia bacterium]|jgi:predicted oxidoreductase|nr:aldo/keto reductase [Acidimicrobiia bacterium]